MKNKVIVGALGMACVVGGLTWATPTVGLLVGTILSFGTSGDRISEQVHVA